jgi:predicted transcriptional regulator
MLNIMTRNTPTSLTRRERQIMDVLYRLGQATAAEIQERLPEPPSYSATRTMLRILEEKGHIRHEEKGPRYVFSPKISRESARKSALRHLVQTFFEGSAAQVVSTLVNDNTKRLSDGDLEQLARMIDKARKEGK